LDGSSCVAVAPVGSEHVVSDVDLARAQPLPLAVVVDPADDLVARRDAGSRFGIIAARPQPSVEDLVASSDENLRISRPRRAESDFAVAHRNNRGHVVSISRPAAL
jgi:hypothetical protein